MPQIFNETHSDSHSSELNAETYSKVNDSQLQYGKRLAISAGMKRGDKVLDMGCGTGELTSFLAERVGKEGQVAGVDPDLKRIKIAIQKHTGSHENITFEHGDSASQFPHFDEQHYDIHFSNFVFQWLNNEEKEIFVDTAFKCLKSGGKIAIQTFEEDAEIIKEARNLFLDVDAQSTSEKVPTQFPVEKSITETLLQKSGFVILSSDYFQPSYSFPSAEEFLFCFCASDYYDEATIPPDKKKDFLNKIMNKDGTVTLFFPSVYQIVAIKKSIGYKMI